MRVSQILEQQVGVSLVKTTYAPPESRFNYEAEVCSEQTDMQAIYYALEIKGYKASLKEIKNASKYKVVSSGSKKKRRLLFWKEDKEIR